MSSSQQPLNLRETSNSRKRTRSPEPNEIPYKRINHSSLLTLASVATVALEASQLGRPQILYVPVGPVAFAQPSYVCHYVTPPQPTAPSEPGGPAPRKFPCEFCDLSFRRRQDLERHELCLHKRGKIADVELPYVCGCGQRFARRDACSRHVRKGEREHGSACKMPSAMKRGPRMSGRIKASMTFQGMNGFLGGVGIGTEQASSENRLMGGTGMVGGQVGSVADEKS
ncbi:hypothetical protein HK101_001283 [Irineochytrium annulatum]|nr:hypothetical protein HK101_001283 [Irineochytrium annulatum]